MSDPRVDLLGETAADMELDADPAPPPARARADIFDKLARHDAANAMDDPEAGRMRVARKIRSTRVAAAKKLKSSEGQWLVSIGIALAGVCAAILAVIHQTTPYVVAAAVLTLPSLLFCYNRYQKWLGDKRYIFRLAQTLGEDVSDFSLDQRFRRIRRKKRR